ncbi:MAG: GntR family transcriptional regulator [Actinomycetales bacterium]
MSATGGAASWQEELHLADEPTPVSEQLRRQVVEAVAEGRARPGDRLPTVRGLAARLALAPGTVAKAYRALEADGVVVTATRAGTVIADTSSGVRYRLAAAVSDVVAAARAAELSESELLDEVRAAWRG